jgi:hypothetical protein|tara:strand:- start:1509 stop:1646 length:138 start_codon:yes stop_codon:yes gene_type:complete
MGRTVIIINLDPELDKSFRERFVRKRGDLSGKIKQLMRKALEEEE